MQRRCDTLIMNYSFLWHCILKVTSINSTCVACVALKYCKVSSGPLVRKWEGGPVKSMPNCSVFFRSLTRKVENLGFYSFLLIDLQNIASQASNPKEPKVTKRFFVTYFVIYILRWAILLTWQHIFQIKPLSLLYTFTALWDKKKLPHGRPVQSPTMWPEFWISCNFISVPSLLGTAIPWFFITVKFLSFGLFPGMPEA